jgi:hypothetical protein
MAPTHHTPVTANRSDRVMGKPRTCRDCGATYRYTTTHHNSRYCTTCLRAHPRRCTACKQLFRPQIDTDRLCPVHFVHGALFGHHS